MTRTHSTFYMYGGIVRSLLLGDSTAYPDYDFIGDFDIDKIQEKFSKLCIGRWDKFQTIKLKIGSEIYDFTATKDLKKRISSNDINSSVVCLGSDGSVLDYFGGLESIENKEIKVTDPDEKIKQDPSRILRIFRFAAELGFTI